jgi:hypothetical protein
MQMISTRHLSELPAIPPLKRLTQSLAMLDAIIERRWQYRYYSFKGKWAEGEQMASMDNGSGDNFYCVFGAPGAFLKGFDHESEMSPWANEPHRIWPGVLDDVPEKFKAFASEPAFEMEATTFCIWRGPEDVEWVTGKISYPESEDTDGSAALLSILDGNPNTYKEWAEGYYERPVSLSAIEQIYGHEPLTQKLLRELNTTVDIAPVAADAVDIDYPIA